MRTDEAEAYASTASTGKGVRNLLGTGAGAEVRTAADGRTKPEALRLMEAAVERSNMLCAYERVVKNKGAAFLEQRLKLKVNAAKSAVARPWQRKFLGYSMTWHKKPKLKIAHQSRERFAEKVRKTLREARGGSLKQAVERLNPVLRGWVALRCVLPAHRSKRCAGRTRRLDQA